MSAVPDHSTLTVFRQRLVQRGKLKVFEEMLAEIVQTAIRKGIHFGTLQIVDSVHSVANVNVEKDERRQKKGKPPRDPDAGWGSSISGKSRTKRESVSNSGSTFTGTKRM